jgi:hypothetical protein
MKHSILASALLAGLGIGAAPVPSQALPISASGVGASHRAVIVQVRMSRRHRMRQGSASRGNAGMPSRGAGGQQYGQTTGGRRR